MPESTLGHNKYEIRVTDGQSLDGFSSTGDITSGVYTFVYDVGTKTLATLYTKTGASLANPITRSQFATDGVIKFYVPATSVDLFVAHSDGSCASYMAVTPQVHTVKLDRSHTASKCLVFPMAASAGGSETDTGLDLPKDVIVYDARIQVTTSDATETVSVGLLASETNGDADGFLATVSVAATGHIANQATTAGSNETYLSTNYYGALMGTFLVGADAAGDVGTSVLTGHVVTGSNATSVSYTPSSSDTFAGYGYVYFRYLR